jgi:hypothetical protein
MRDAVILREHARLGRGAAGWFEIFLVSQSTIRDSLPCLPVGGHASGTSVRAGTKINSPKTRTRILLPGYHYSFSGAGNMAELGATLTRNSQYRQSRSAILQGCWSDARDDLIGTRRCTPKCRAASSKEHPSDCTTGQRNASFPRPTQIRRQSSQQFRN